MRLKRLETFGFKSFADRMSFDFENGITAVIGPNGCGKSNIVDSIKWVIGEQSAKALRGEDMTDVIFNGCATRRGMAICEVTLVMDQVDGGRLGLEGDEIAITRRLTRDGTSNYYLNGQVCRLKDIKELFMDTGIGTSAYAVIEQGRVGFIVDANTKDRRAILEEAADISRYKARRKVALRKLERVELDLQRIGEVLAEVSRRVKTVARQAATALRHRELTATLRDLRMAFALEEFGRLSNEMKELAGRADELNASGAELAAKLGELEASLAEADARLIALEETIRGFEAQRADAQSRRDVAESRARDAKYRLIEIDQHEQQDKTALDALAAKIEAIAAEHATAERAVDDSATGGESDSALTQTYRQKRTDLDATLAEVDAIITDVEERKAKQVECLRDLARVTAERNALEAGRHAIGERRRRLEDRSGGQATALVTARESETTARASLEALVKGAADAHIALDELIRARETALAEGNRLDAELNDVRHQEARAETSLRLLQEQERRAEGVFRGVKDVIQQMDRFPGVVGMVADLCRVPDAYVVAIETALGGQAQNIVTETQEAAKAAIEFLKRERRGRATFLPLDDIQGGERVDNAVLREPGVIGLASRLLEYDKKHKPAFEHLLGNVLIVETLDHAINLRRGRRTSCRLVTLEGDVVNAGGAMTGGRQQGGDAGGIVSRKNEIRSLDEQMKEIQAKKLEAGQKRDVAKKQAFDLSLSVEEKRRSIQQIDRAAGEAKAQVMKAERDRAHIEETTSSFTSELAEIDSEMLKLDSDAKELHGQDEWFGALNAKLAQEIEVATARMQAKAAERDRLQEQVNNLRVDLATTQERQEALRNHLGHLTRTLQELEDQRDERTRRIAGHGAKRDELRAIQGENTAIHAEAGAEFERIAAQLTQVIGERDRLRDGSEGRRQEARALSSRARGVEQERQAVEVKSSEARVRVEALTQRILEEYQLDLGEAFANYERPANLDWPALRKQLNDTEKELGSLGAVNLAAIDELAEVQGREEFLAKQHADLDHAAVKLKEIIEHINEVSRKLFQKTYREVRANFQTLFRKLFNGGKADLILEKPVEGESDDVLELGIEIMAQPPGKHPKIITQLSGGEKALTAIALLFAVYQTKPSPFCILDEVDAPLDDSNTDVYCSMLKEFVRDSQFIVITHNKSTMKHADAIYGITQNEPGVSTKVSVRFEDVAEGAEPAEIVRGAGPYST